MTRSVKEAKKRRLEIIQTAEKLFRLYGYNETSVDAIVKEVGVAKGLFYYYFKSKADVLEAIVEHQLERVVQMAKQVADDPSMDALTKMQLLLSDSHIGDEDMAEIAEQLHLPANRELHEFTNIQTILKLSPILAKIVAQGNREKVFNVTHPLETVQFLLTGSQFLLDGGLFNFSEQEIRDRRLVMQEIVEKSLGVEPGTFGFMSDTFSEGEQMPLPKPPNP